MGVVAFVLSLFLLFLLEEFIGQIIGDIGNETDHNQYRESTRNLFQSRKRRS